MKKRLISVLAVISVISMLCGCSEAKDLCREMLENTRDFLMDNEKGIESRDEYESSYKIIDTETALPDESDYIPLPEDDNPIEYDEKWFSVSPGDKWECFDYSDNDCMYVIKDPKTVEEAGLVISFRVAEGIGSKYFSLHELIDDMDTMYEDLDYEILEQGDTRFREYDAYYYSAVSPYETFFTITSFQTEECYFSIDIVYSAGHSPDEVKKLSDEIISTFVIK